LDLLNGRNAQEHGWRGTLIDACALSKEENLIYVLKRHWGVLPPPSWRNRVDEARAIMAGRGFMMDPDDRVQILFACSRKLVPRRGGGTVGIVRCDQNESGEAV